MSLLEKRWACAPYDVLAAERLSAELEVSRTVATILVRRGFGTPEEARGFLRAEDRHDPWAMPGMAGGCETILDHVERGSRIVVHGDYDVDGVCSTAVLVRALRRLGADPSWLLPSRRDDGYGLTSETVARLAGEGADLVVTVDCGVTAVAEVGEALARGIDVVVSDHHRPGPELPPCPVIHPALGGYPFAELCATGVAHKMAEALYASAGLDPTLGEEDLDLVALATVADLVPLRGENRRLVRAGLRALGRTEKPGLRALMRISGADRAEPTEHALGFRLAPRINAAGRLRRADPALELLLTEDEGRATEVADELDLVNRERQDVESRILFAAEAARAEQADAPAYVLAGEGWHPGVIGIVASRIVERHHRPCVMIALDGESGRGSGRSISPYDLHAGLAACSEHLERFGGHRMAAGLEVAAERVGAFREAFVDHARRTLSPSDLVAVERVDAVVPGGTLGLDLAEELGKLAPFGSGNPRPALLVPAARVEGVSGMGEDAQHARFLLSSGGTRARCVAFRTSARSLSSACGDGPHDVAVTLEVNEWNGTVEPRLVLRAACATARGEALPAGGDEDFWTGFDLELDARARTATVAGDPSARPVRDRRGEGVAGVAGDLLSSGDSVLLVCADPSRRREGVETLLGGLARAAPSGRAPALGLASWASLESEPALAAPFRHVVAMDPPASATGVETLARCASSPEPGGGLAHLAWGAAEVEFALACAHSELALDEALRDVYRRLRAAGDSGGPQLEAALRGEAPRGRSPAACARVARILWELGLIRLERGSGGARRCLVLEAARTSLERSPSYRAHAARLGEVEAYLRGEGERLSARRVPSASARSAG